MLLVVEPGVLGDGLDPVFGLFETPPCCFYPYRLHGLCWSTAPLFCIGPREVPRAHVDLFCKRANSEIAPGASRTAFQRGRPV